jgi:hypothetical protein
MIGSILKKIGVTLSLNDPQWGRGSKNNQDGKKPAETPPDLDQVWKDLNQRLSAFLGQKTGGDGGGLILIPRRRNLVSVRSRSFLFLSGWSAVSLSCRKDRTLL